jgi:putative membrane protein
MMRSFRKGAYCLQEVRLSAVIPRKRMRMTKQALLSRNTVASPVKGALVGAVAGIAGTLAMNYAQRLWTLMVDRNPPSSAAGPHDARDWQERSEDQNANEMVAQMLARTTINRRLSDRELSVVAPIVHFGFGAAAGAAYGVYVNTASEDRASGAAFGSALWLAADEIAMPLVGLSDSTRQRPLEMHTQSLVAHLVYGVVTERVRRLIRRALDGRDATDQAVLMRG